MKSRSIERDGVRLHGLWSSGHGEPVIVIPGVMADAEAFEPVVQAMESSQPVVVLDRRVEIINLEVSGVPAARVEALRGNADWTHLCRLAEPLVSELDALNAFKPHAGWVDVPAQLILGENNQGTEPYGLAFDRIVAHLPRSNTTILPGQGHLAHVENPMALGCLISELMRLEI